MQSFPNETEMDAVVDHWDDEEGCGRLRLADGRRVFVLFSVLEGFDDASGFRSVRPGMTVSALVTQASQDEFDWIATLVRPSVIEESATQ